MAVTFNATGLITNGACYTRTTLTPQQRKALMIYAKAAILFSVTGVDYTASLATTLITDSTQAVCGITPDQLEAGMVAIWMEAAQKTAVSLTTKLAAVNCLANANPAQLELADAFLTAKILAGEGL